MPCKISIERNCTTSLKLAKLKIKKMKTKKMDKNFGKGFAQGIGNYPVQSEEYRRIRDEIMQVLNIKTVKQFALYKYGDMEMNISEARATEEIFRQHGIEHCWNFS